MSKPLLLSSLDKNQTDKIRGMLFTTVYVLEKAYLLATDKEREEFELSAKLRNINVIVVKETLEEL